MASFFLNAAFTRHNFPWMQMTKTSPWKQHGKKTTDTKLCRSGYMDPLALAAFKLSTEAHDGMCQSRSLAPSLSFCYLIFLAFGGGIKRKQQFLGHLLQENAVYIKYSMLLRYQSNLHSLFFCSHKKTILSKQSRNVQSVFFLIGVNVFLKNTKFKQQNTSPSSPEDTISLNAPTIPTCLREKPDIYDMGTMGNRPEGRFTEYCNKKLTNRRSQESVANTSASLVRRTNILEGERWEHFRTMCLWFCVLCHN